MSEASPPSLAPLPQVIIAGYGVPGRAVAEILTAQQIPFIVIERNAAAADRCIQAGVNMVSGDVRDETLLRKAGIENARLLILAMPDDAACLQAIDLARRLNPTITILARCTFTSAGLQATAKGAAEVIVAEQVVAREMSQVLGRHLPGTTGK